MKRNFFILLFIMVISGIDAQQIPHFSQYSLNHYSINPAATGNTERLPLAFSYRKLWAGIAQSPSVQYLSGHLKIAPTMGAGIKFYNYQTGPIRKTGAELTYSYHLELNSDLKWSFGLSGFLYQYHLKKSDLNIENPNDPVFLGNDKMIVPDAAFGTYLYHPQFYVGIAIPQLFNRSIDLKTDKVLQQKQVRHYYFHGGYIIEASSDVKIEPSVLLKFVEVGLFQADINAQMSYRDMLLFGLSFRTSDALVVNLGYKNENFLIGYAIDIAVAGLKTSTFGSHEILLVYTLDNFLQ